MPEPEHEHVPEHEHEHVPEPEQERSRSWVAPGQSTQSASEEQRACLREDWYRGLRVAHRGRGRHGGGLRRELLYTPA